MTTINSKSDLNRAVANALHPEPPTSQRRAIHESGVWRWARYHTPVTRNEWGRWEPADFCGDPVASYAQEQRIGQTLNWVMIQNFDGWRVWCGGSVQVVHVSRFIAMCLGALRALGVEFELVEGWDQR
jgi:hypothetical protein